jgi:hypothetical protein
MIFISFKNHAHHVFASNHAEPIRCLSAQVLAGAIKP